MESLGIFRSCFLIFEVLPEVGGLIRRMDMSVARLLAVHDCPFFRSRDGQNTSNIAGGVRENHMGGC